VADAASVVVPWLLTPELTVVDDDAVRAMKAYELAAVQRATYLADHALREQLPWVAQLGGAPLDAARRGQYLATVSAVAAFRENYGVGNDDVTLLGDDRETVVQAQVEALVQLYREEGVAVPADDLVMTVVGTRETSFPGRAFTQGAAGSSESFPGHRGRTGTVVGRGRGVQLVTTGCAPSCATLARRSRRWKAASPASKATWRLRRNGHATRSRRSTPARAWLFGR